MNPKLHLSEAEFYEALDRPGALAAHKHLAACTQCRAEVDALQASLQGLRMAATNLAEAEFRPRLELRPPGLWSRVQTWPLTLAAAAVLCAASFTFAHRASTAAPAEGKTQAAVESASAETDTALLDGIDRDLSTSVAPSLAPLDISATEAVEAAAKVN